VERDGGSRTLPGQLVDEGALADPGQVISHAAHPGVWGVGSVEAATFMGRGGEVGFDEGVPLQVTAMTCEDLQELSTDGPSRRRRIHRHDDVEFTREYAGSRQSTRG
jgi:hypothetical protein